MKINICDPCYKQDKTVVETNRVLRVKGKSFLNLDICPKHAETLGKLSMPDYVRAVYKLQGLELTETDQEIIDKFLR